MPDIKVQPHADGIGGDQIVHVSILIKRHLRVARPGRQRPHHHGAAALLPPDQLGNGIDIFNRKADDGAARRHTAYLFRTCPGQGRESIPLHELHAGHQRRNRAAHGV